MKMILAAAVALAIMPSSALAEECVPPEQAPEADVALQNGDRMYIDGVEPECWILWGLSECGIGVVVYEESNGIPGLQRNDRWAGDQACGKPDALIMET